MLSPTDSPSHGSSVRAVMSRQWRGTTGMLHAFLLPLVMVCVLLNGCGYVMRGQQGSISPDSVLGTGNKTLKIQSVEQPTLYPWVPYIIRSQLRDEINARNMAVWRDSGPADFELAVKVHSFQVNAYGQSREENLLFTASINMELVLYNGVTNTEVWKSGPLYYSENYENVNEESAIREILQLIVRRAVDRLQQQF